MAASSQSAREIRYAATLSAVMTMRMMGLFLILPVFMVLAADMPGYTPQAAGLAVGIYGLTQALMQQPFGWLSDRWGRRQALLLGLAVFAAGGIVAALADTLPELIVGRALQGCGAIAGVTLALAADVTRPQRRGLVMAIIGMGIGAAFLVSIVASVPLAMVLGLGGLFWLTVAFAVAGMALVLTVPAVTPLAEPRPGEQRIPMAPVWLLALSVCLLHAVMTLLFVTLPPMLVETFGLPLREHWSLYLPTMVLSVVIVLPILRSVGRKLAERSILPWAFIGLGAAIALLPLGGGWAALAVLLTLYFVAFNLLEASMPALLSRTAGARGRGRRMSLFSTFQFLGAFLGGAVGGWLLARLGSGPALTAAGVICLLWSGFMAFASRRLFLTGAGN